MTAVSDVAAVTEPAAVRAVSDVAEVALRAGEIMGGTPSKGAVVSKCYRSTMAYSGFDKQPRHDRYAGRRPVTGDS
nr:hypothetical protein KitaXyl93_66580 [Kitasatospora sp. Xyl93]